MVDSPVDQPPRWRRRLRLSVRVFMVLVLVLGGGFGWIVHEARVQRQAVAAIERAGGKVDYDESFLGYSPERDFREPGWKEWLVDHLGIDYFESAKVSTLAVRPGLRKRWSTMRSWPRWRDSDA